MVSEQCIYRSYDAPATPHSDIMLAANVANTVCDASSSFCAVSWVFVPMQLTYHASVMIYCVSRWTLDDTG